MSAQLQELKDNLKQCADIFRYHAARAEINLGSLYADIDSNSNLLTMISDEERNRCCYKDCDLIVSTILQADELLNKT